MFNAFEQRSCCGFTGSLLMLKHVIILNRVSMVSEKNIGRRKAYIYIYIYIDILSKSTYADSSGSDSNYSCRLLL